MPWAGGFFEDKTCKNRRFLARNKIDSWVYEGVQCNLDRPDFFQMRDIESACIRWTGNRLVIGWCVHLLAVAHCLHAGGGIKGMEHRKAATCLFNAMLESGRRPTEVIGEIDSIADHKSVRDQFHDERGIGFDITYTAKDVEAQSIHDIGCQMRKDGLYTDAVKGLRCEIQEKQ